MGNRQVTVRELLLTRRGLVFLSSEGPRLPDEQVRAVELELAALGYVPSARLAARMAGCTLDELVAFRAWAVDALRAHVGADQTHEPLFRSFPDGVPDDTEALWWAKVLVHFLQADGQPCLFCRRTGTTHVLSPCRHVVCDHCFDGANYSACPVCEHKVDRSSPFFKPSTARGTPVEKVVFKLLDLGESASGEAKALFTSLCERTQALSPADRDALVTILTEHGSEVLAWLPEAIPVRENVAAVFGTLFGACDPDQVMPHARRFMKTATDVLRFIAVLSGTDGSLLRQTVYKQITRLDGSQSVRDRVAKLFAQGGGRLRTVTVPVQVSRFKMARLPRPLRRALLGVMEGMNPDRLAEDMLRHRSYWVWVGEFLHPHEHAAKFPNVARAFQIVRGKGPDGAPAPEFRTWYSRLEQGAKSADADAMLAVLTERPGELARRFDHALRLAGDDAARDRVVAAFAARSGRSPRRSCSPCAAISRRGPSGPRCGSTGRRGRWRAACRARTSEPRCRADRSTRRSLSSTPSCCGASPGGRASRSASSTRICAPWWRRSTSARPAARRSPCRVDRGSRCRPASWSGCSSTGASRRARTGRATSICRWRSTTSRGATSASAPTTS